MVYIWLQIAADTLKEIDETSSTAYTDIWASLKSCMHVFVILIWCIFNCFYWWNIHSRLFDLFIITVSVTIITVISVSISNVNNSDLYKGKGKCIRDWIDKATSILNFVPWDIADMWAQTISWKQLRFHHWRNLKGTLNAHMLSRTLAAITL